MSGVKINQLELVRSLSGQASVSGTKVMVKAKGLRTADEVGGQGLLVDCSHHGDCIECMHRYTNLKLPMKQYIDVKHGCLLNDSYGVHVNNSTDLTPYRTAAFGAGLGST